MTGFGAIHLSFPLVGTSQNPWSGQSSHSQVSVLHKHPEESVHPPQLEFPILIDWSEDKFSTARWREFINTNSVESKREQKTVKSFKCVIVAFDKETLV